ncbi:hypothetical protein EVA_15614 [gut metagenome]|uniref:Uncharacterized protein n=1 Tax=gut metagenome TaxID=749906 RepID=J9FP90_9ZZZZ
MVCQSVRSGISFPSRVLYPPSEVARRRLTILSSPLWRVSIAPTLPRSSMSLIENAIDYSA